MADQQGAAMGYNGLPFAPNVATTSPSSTATQVKPTKEYLAGINRGQAAYGQQAAGMQAETAAHTDVAQGQADIINGYRPGTSHNEDPFEDKIRPGQAAQDEMYMQERQALRARHQANIQQAHQQYDQRYQAAVNASNPSSWWDDKTTDQKLGARLGMFLSAFGAGYAHQDNKALSYIQDAVKQDAENKSRRADRLFKLADMSKGALSDAYRERAEELSDIDLNHAAGLKMVANQAEIYAKAMLPRELQAQAQQKVAALNVEAAKAYQEAHEKLNTKIESQSGHSVTTVGIGAGLGGRNTPSTEDVKQSAMAESNREDALRVQQLTKDGFAPSPELANEILDRQNVVMANQRKEGEDAFRSFVGSIARGAGMPASIFPKGTPPETREWWNKYQTTLHGYAMDKFRGNSWISEYDHTIGPLGINRDETSGSIVSKANTVTGHVIHIGDRVAEVSKTAERERLREGGGNQIPLPAYARKALGMDHVAGPPAPAPTVPQLIEQGRALKAAGDIAGAKRIHDQIKARLESGER